MRPSEKIIKTIDSTQLMKWPLQELSQLDQDYFPWPWKPAQWDTLGDNDTVYLLIFNSEKNINGFILAQQNDYEKMSHLLKILVLPDRQNQGLGFNLMHAYKSELKKQKFDKIFLEVAVNNQKAVQFYQKLGFQILTRVAGFYPGEDAYRMELII